MPPSSVTPAPSHHSDVQVLVYVTKGPLLLRRLCSGCWLEGTHCSGVPEGGETGAELLRSSFFSCAFSMDTWRGEGPESSGHS